MAFEFKLPDLGEGIVEGEIVSFLVKEGDKVKEDTPLMEVMTDKATVEITSPKNGTIGKLMVKVGDLIQVGQVILTINVVGEESKPSPSENKTPSKTAPTPSPKPHSSSSPPSTMVKASPATRKMARTMGIDLSLVQGSGPGGRITNEDLEKFKKGKSDAASSPVVEGEVERIPFIGMRKKISENMHRSKQNAAHFSYVDTVDATQMVKFREFWKGEADKRGLKITFLPFMMKAAVEALKKYPRFNASLDEAKQEIILKKYYNIGIATATEKGLIVPVVKDVDKKNILDLAKEVKDLSARAREGKAKIEELKGSTFTITSLGAMGGLFATPIINYPETAILGIYQIKPTPVVVDNKIEIRQIMYFSLSLDHRVIDGHEAASFGNEFKKPLENPQSFFQKIM